MREALIYYKNDFKTAAAKANIQEKVIDGLAAHFKKCLPAWEAMINMSFLQEELKLSYVVLLQDRFERMGF